VSRAEKLNAKIANIKRWHPDRDTTELERERNEAKLTAYVKKVVSEAPPLTDEQRQRIAQILLESEQR
jgi:hypothetical protein